MSRCAEGAGRLAIRRVLFGKVERPLFDQFAKMVQVNLIERLIVVAVEVFLVANGTFGDQIQYVIFAERADQDGILAKQIFALAICQ